MNHAAERGWISHYVAILRPLVFSLFVAFGLVVAHKSALAAQQPNIPTAGNGVPLINILTPSAGCVSRYTHRQFNVQTLSVILNNSRTNTQTQLSGWVGSNP